MNTSTALAVPSKIKPKPTKAEIIDALTRLKIAKLNKEKLEAAAKRDELASKIDARLVEVVRVGMGKLVPEIKYGWVNYDHVGGKRVYRNEVSSVEVTFALRDLPKEAVKMLIEYHASRDAASISVDASHVRKQIAAAASGFTSRDERVSAMLEDEDSRKALDAMLESIS